MTTDIGLKTWASPPLKVEVQELIVSFFSRLQDGDIEEARDLVSHEYADWDEALFTLWRDLVLAHEPASARSFTGHEWRIRPSWLKDLGTRDTMEWLGSKTLWVDLVYKGRPSGYIGEFKVLQCDAGFCVQRVLFKMA